MTLIRWNPFADVNTLQSRVNRLFNEMARGEEPTTTWTPLADILETQEALVLHIELPGMSRDDIDLRIENNILTIRGERKPGGEVRPENYHRLERYYGTFSRAFSLPVMVDQERITADYQEGVLTVTLPKREQAKAKRIEIAA